MKVKTGNDESTERMYQSAITMMTTMSKITNLVLKMLLILKNDRKNDGE